eukprot:GAHX01002226.1.p1 GENE.GAHX01002226.1~~GAHX01002226.1.p1  ORF type:complete len:205 (-),score=51.58 GAHX01002226.1:348-962(-)
MEKTVHNADEAPFDNVDSFNEFLVRFESDNEKIYKNISDLENLRDKVETDLFKLRDEKEHKSLGYKEELENRITNGTYKLYFKDNYAKNHKIYNQFKEEILDVYRKHQFGENFIDHIRGKNICELVEEFPEPTFCFCNKVSEGDMISCEGKSCEFEWFHVSCVGQVPEDEAFICNSCRSLQNTYKELTEQARNKVTNETNKNNT